MIMLHKFSLIKTQSKIISITLLFVVCILLVLKHFSLHKNDNFGAVSTAEQWQQPSILNEQYPQLISKHTWNFEFNEIEKILKRLELDSNHDLVINFDTTDQLKLVIFELKAELTDEQWQRVDFLMQKSLGGRNGKVFYGLVNAYYFYQKEYLSYLKAVNHSTAIEKLALLKSGEVKQFNMQSKYFGIDAAIKLFSRDNTTTNYLNSRRIVNMERGLSNTEKKKILLQLSDNYKKTVSQW